ncbi:MAG: DNA primase [Trueperaceae bacterium]
MSDAKERIRERIELADVIGETVALKPAGRDRLKGLCPFHAEKTPSFHVHTGRGFYYCFGCGAKGDLFDFVMQTRGVEFVEAMQLLGERAGIEVDPAPAGPKSGRRRDLMAVNRLAEAWFRTQLDGEALAYLRDRGLNDDSIEAWGLGWAPEGWDGLLRHALTEGVRDDDLLAAGLLSENERGRRYDRFRGRVIFPIRDRLGRTIAFAGRVLNDAVPKYLNTPETDLFDKGSTLYGLDRARGAIRERGEALVVEGYMDVIALHQTGFDHAVAALGANLTEGQANELARLDASRLLLAFDADEAGQRAVLSGLDQAVGRRFLVQAVTVPAGKDPADAVLGGHVEAFAAALRSGASEVRFRFRSVMEAHDTRTPEGRKAILEALAPSMASRGLHDEVAAEMRRLVTDALELDERRLNAWLDARSKRPLDEVQVRGLQRSGTPDDAVAATEIDVMALLLSEPGRLRARLPRVIEQIPPELEPSRLREFAAVCEEERFDADRVLARYRGREEGDVLFSRLFEHELEADAGRTAQRERHLETGLSRLRERVLEHGTEEVRRRLRDRMASVQERLAASDLSGDDLREAYGELAELQAALAAREAERRVRLPSGFGRSKRR